MPIRSRADGVLDEDDLSMLESVLTRLGGDQQSREHYAAMLIQLFQSGVTDPVELMRRINESL